MKVGPWEIAPSGRWERRTKLDRREVANGVEVNLVASVDKLTRSREVSWSLCVGPALATRPFKARGTFTVGTAFDPEYEEREAIRVAKLTVDAALQVVIPFEVLDPTCMVDAG